MSPDPALSSPTSEFCAEILHAAARPLPAPVAYAARRSLFNVLGTAVGAAHSPAVETVLAAAYAQHGRVGEVVIPGRSETLGPHWGTLLVGIAAHLDDFDDTHLATVIHPGAAVLATVLGLAPETHADGARTLDAFALGCEAQLRIGNAISPSHYDGGWHITGTCGVFGSAVAAGLLLDLDAAGMERALSLAAVMLLGHREAFGSMTKPFHPGKAAVNGILAARLGARELSGIPDPLGHAGVLSVISGPVDFTALHSWEREWELELNTFKPYPCGIVAHPVIDAAIAASKQVLDPNSIMSISIICNPLVPELMGRQQPADGLQARFSSYHTAAAGILCGEVGLAQFNDAWVTTDAVSRLREKITLVPDSSCARDAATIRVERQEADPIVVHIPHARGSLARPLTEAELFSKVDRLVSPVLGSAAATEICKAVDGLPDAATLDALLTSIRPTTAAGESAW